MKNAWILFCLALIPTNLVLADHLLDHNLYGLWYDAYSDTHLEIKDHRRGLKARRIVHGRKKKWRTYYGMGRGVFDDCDGRTLIVLGPNRIEWRQGRRNTIIFRRSRGSLFDSRRYRGNDRYYDESRSDYGYRDWNRRFRDDYCGEWYCEDYGLRLHIESYRDGFRARRHGRDGWTYYSPYGRNGFRDNRGNRYYFDGDDLIWSSGRDRRHLRFRKK